MIPDGRTAPGQETAFFLRPAKSECFAGADRAPSNHTLPVAHGAG
jgi:hypothetical protein